MKVGVLASGGGTNLQSLIDAASNGAPFEVSLVLSDRSDAGALKRAETAGISHGVIGDPADGAAIIELLRSAGIRFVVLAGYLKLLPQEVIAAYPDAVINIHPAPLPGFGGAGMYGIKVHRAVIQSGATVSGPTVHLVSEEYDRGTILAQWPVPVRAGDTPELLQQRVLEAEHQLLPTVVSAAANNSARATRLLFKLDPLPPRSIPAHLCPSPSITP